MKVMLEDIISIIDAVGTRATERKKQLEIEYSKVGSDDISALLKWYRSRKNIDLKDALTLDGLKRGYSVRAEKTMGALPEYCSETDQNSFNRFDLSWESSKDTRDFILAVEIEMDLDLGSIIKDFKKLVMNKSECLKVMVCQAKNEKELEAIRSEVESHIRERAEDTANYLLSIWVWPTATFEHYHY